jgi:Spx/MgsR family transcriptional regulator
MYGLDNCDTCRKARKWMTRQGVAHEFTDYRNKPVSADTLRDWAGKVGGWEKLVNRASTTWRTLTAEQKLAATEDQWLALIVANPQLVKRPVLVTADGQVSVGFSESTYQARFS